MSQPINNKKSGSLEIPPRPKEPDPYECCGRGCDPCIHDYYAQALARWEQRVAQIKLNYKKSATKTKLLARNNGK